MAMKNDFDPEHSPTALFCALETALDRGDLRSAAELQQRLAALGFTVTAGKRNLKRRSRSRSGVPPQEQAQGRGKRGNRERRRG